MHMADQKQLDILRQGVEEWNKWRMQYPDIRPNLIRANLSGINLELINFSYASLIGIDLSYANLRIANLSYAELNSANLVSTDLAYASLMSANLAYAQLNSTNLNYANLTSIQIDNTNFSDANLDGTNLSDVSINNANFTNASFKEARFRRTTFGDIDLRTVKGLDTASHDGPSTIGTNCIERSQGNIPENFLRGVGLSDAFIKYVRALVQRPIDYYTCFISYSSKDEMFATRLHNDLQSEGVRCWFAPQDMDIGDKIRHRIDESIRLYDKLLLILSEHSIASSWVAYEVERALNKEPTGIPNVLYPLRLDNAILTCEKEWAQDIKQTRHIGNFEGWKTNHDAYQESFKRLLRALKPKDTTNKAGG